MKKVVMILFITAALFTLSLSAIADTISTVGAPNGFGPYQTGSGGEFTLLPSSGALVNTAKYYSGQPTQTKNWVQTGTFQSFCLEELEYIYANTTFDALVSSKAINGGVGPQGDPISIGTAYLYSQFAAGTLAGYNYGAGRNASAALLQNAIWALEDETINPATGANMFYDLVAAMWTNPEADANGAYNVKVLNLYAVGHAGDENYRRQDMLTIVPEPLTLMLLGVGLVGVAGFSRKLKS